MKNILLLLFLFITTFVFAQSNNSIVKLSNPPAVNSSKGYSQLAEVTLGTGKMLILSGQVALDVKGNLVGAGDIEKQTEQVFINIKNIVESAGGTMDNVIKLNYFMKDLNQIGTVRLVRDRYINTKIPPTSTLVEVSKLFREDVLIEIEATAIIPSKE